MGTDYIILQALGIKIIVLETIKVSILALLLLFGVLSTDLILV